MTRILGIELRRSNAPALAVLLTAIGVGLIALNGSLVQYEWLRFAYDHSTSLFLLVPLALAGGALLGRREKRTRADELIASTGRPRAQRLLPGLLALGLAAAAAHLIVFAGGATMAAINGGYTTAVTLLWPLTGILVLVGAAWLGVAAGRAWSSPLVPPIVAVLGLILQVGFSESGPPGEPSSLANLSLLAQPPSFAWETINGRALIGYAVLGAGLIGAGFLLAVGRSWLPRVAAVPVIAVAGVIAAVVPGDMMADRYHVDTAAQKLVCADQVCVTAVHAFALEEAAPQVREALRLLAKLPGAPTRAAEWRADRVYQPGDSNWDMSGTTRPEPGTVNFDLDLDGGKVGSDLTEDIVLGAGTWWNGCLNGQDLVAAQASGAWLMGKDELAGADDLLGRYPEEKQQARNIVRGLRALPEKDQIRRVAAMRDASLSCESVDLTAILTGRASS